MIETGFINTLTWCPGCRKHTGLLVDLEGPSQIAIECMVCRHEHVSNAGNREAQEFLDAAAAGMSSVRARIQMAAKTAEGKN